MMKCDRCQKETGRFTMSKMNTDNLCMECIKDEKKHPRFGEASDLEYKEVLKGNYNYLGLFYGQKWPFGWVEEGATDGE